jgi:hypothetical protein
MSNKDICLKVLAHERNELKRVGVLAALSPEAEDLGLEGTLRDRTRLLDRAIMVLHVESMLLSRQFPGFKAHLAAGDPAYRQAAAKQRNIYRRQDRLSLELRKLVGNERKTCLF